MFVLTIQLQDKQREIDVSEQQTSRLLTDVLRGAGVPLNTRCGYRGLCDGCLVELTSGALQQSSGDATVEPDSSLVRGCQICVPTSGAATVHIPARSLLTHQPQVVASFRLNVPRAHDPLWQTIHVRPGDLAETLTPSEAILKAAVAQLECDLPIQWNRAAVVPDEVPDRDVQLVVEHWGDCRTVRFGESTEPAFGLAVDVGTTTVVVALVELDTGHVVALASGLNAQTRLGDNVLTRINLCMTEPRIVQRMQQAVVRNTLNPLVSDVVRQAGIGPRQLAVMAVAGNTTMLHLLLGVNPSSLGTAPFTPSFLNHRTVSASELNMKVAVGSDKRVPIESTDGNEEEVAVSTKFAPAMAVHLLPGAAAYVGADITAGVLASGMAYSDETCLLVDLGTNGEIVLRHKGEFIGCATAAGPAFEGAGLAFGVRAGQGAVSHVWLDDDRSPPRIEVIGQGTPIGICGTAYIDFVARARRQGVINATARFCVDDHPSLVRDEENGQAMVVARQENDEPLLITEADMASLLQAKAAIAAGTTCLLRQASIAARDVRTVYLAGGFGFHMHVDSLLGCGMLPGFREEQVETVGNTALAGAYLTLLDSSALREIRRISSQMTIVELNLAPDFEMIYIDQLTLEEGWRMKGCK